MVLNWDLNIGDEEIINKIVDRYLRLTWVNDYDRVCLPQHVKMDITLTHLNCCPLDLDELLKSSYNDFMEALEFYNDKICRRTGRCKNGETIPFGVSVTGEDIKTETPGKPGETVTIHSGYMTFECLECGGGGNFVELITNSDFTEVTWQCRECGSQMKIRG